MNANFRLNVLLNHLGKRQVFNVQTQKTSQSYYKYTLDNPILSREQRDFYEENGFLVFRKLVDDDLLERCRQHFVDLCEGRYPKGPMTLMKDVSLRNTGAKGEYLYNKVQDIAFDPVFEQYILYPKILDIVECFTGPNIAAVHTMLINKPPDSGKETSQHPLHQDLHYFPFRPADRIVASWTAMEPVTVDNGCLFVLPGSHREPLQRHEYPDAAVNKGYHGIRGYDHRTKVNLLMDKGDTVFFHPQLIHGSGVNVTTNFRKAISCHYAASDCYFIDVHGTTQENIAKEVEGIAESKFGLNIDFNTIWRMRARVARGLPLNFEANLM